MHCQLFDIEWFSSDLNDKHLFTEKSDIKRNLSHVMNDQLTEIVEKFE